MTNAIRVLLLTTIMTFSGPVPAKLIPESAANEKERRMEAILKENESSYIYGPGKVELGTQGTMQIQRGQAFIPREIAIKILAAADDKSKSVDDLLGMVVAGLPGDEIPKDDWGGVVIFFKPLGFVRDDDARQWDHTKLLDGLRKGIEKVNEERRKQGEPERQLNGWIEAPRYDELTHRLLWAISTQKKGDQDSAMAVYSTAALGREGLILFSFITEEKKLAARKDLANGMLEAIEFKPGKRYEDFAEGSDRVAEIGLMALIGGVAAKKLGLFAMLFVLLAKWGKLLAIAVSGFAIFKLKKKKDAPH